MKKILVIALALASVNAFGSRARMSALANSPHLVDAQTVYKNPSDMFYVGGDFVSLESGAVGSAPVAPPATTEGLNAEGLVVRSMGDAKLGLSLGHQSKNASQYGLRRIAPANLSGPGNKDQQNPIELTYGMKAGDMAYAGTLVYSNFNNKTTGDKESSAGLRFGMHMGALDATLHLGLVNTLDTKVGAVENKFKGTSAIAATVGYTMDTLYAFGGFTTAGAKNERNGVETDNVSTTDIEVGVISSNKKDASEFFYGAKLVSSSLKNDIAANSTSAAAGIGEFKQTSLSLPISLGLEVDAASWLVLRGSVTQSIPLLNNSKTDAALAAADLEFSPGANTTTAAFGAGLKFNKLTLDGTILAGGAQVYSSAALLGQVGLTYMF